MPLSVLMDIVPMMTVLPSHTNVGWKQSLYTDTLNNIVALDTSYSVPPLQLSYRHMIINSMFFTLNPSAQ